MRRRTRHWRRIGVFIGAPCLQLLVERTLAYTTNSRDVERCAPHFVERLFQV